jgi:hypothetical protein
VRIDSICRNLARRRRAGDGENTGADDGADAESGQAPRTQRLAQPIFRLLEAAISASMLLVRKSLFMAALSV